MLRVMDTKASTQQEMEIVTTIRLPRDLHGRMKALAASQHRTFSQQMRLAFEEHLGAHEVVEQAA